MSIIHFLVAWANAPFTIVGGVAVLFAVLSMTGVMGLLAGGSDHDGHEAGAGGHADGDTDVDADGDVDADVDADHGADVDGDGDGDTDDVDHAGGDGKGISALLLGGLGVGKLPLSLVWQVFAVVFAVTGIGLNARYFGAEVPLVSLGWTLPIAGIVAYGAVGALAKALGPVFASKESEATRRAELVGHVGVVISSRVSPDFGEVRIKDKTGHELRVIVKLAPGSRSPVEKESVVIVEHDDATGALHVAPLDDAPQRSTRLASLEPKRGSLPRSLEDEPPADDAEEASAEPAGDPDSRSLEPRPKVR